jgi:hypothetical protein
MGDLEQDCSGVVCFFGLRNDMSVIGLFKELNFFVVF